MDPVAILLLVFLAGGGAVLFNVLQNEQRMRAWLDVAATCGLQVMEISGFSRLKARAGPLEVRIELYPRRSSHVVVVIPGPLDFCSVRIRPESRVTVPWVREIEIGDASFDATFSIEGPMRLVLALLEAETRRLLLRLNAECGLAIFDGMLRAEMAHRKVPQILPLLLDIGQRLAQSMNTPRRLVENATQDPEAGVRLQNLLVLIRELPEDPGTVEALRAACSDASPHIRLRAAKELGAEGRDVLLKLAESKVEDDAWRAQAVSALGGDLAFERTTAILDQALHRRHIQIQTARACLEVLGLSGDAAAVEPLAKVMVQEKGELAAAAAEALGLTGNAAAEPPLIQALQREEADLRVAVVNALGSVGSAAAVLPLKELAERSWLDRDLQRATRQAIAAIQSRLTGASPGQLSLTGAETGQLSLAQAEAGQLSLAREQGGQLSLSDDEEGLKPTPGGTAS